MNPYETVRQQYQPAPIRFLLIAESPPPSPEVQSSRQFYYTDRIRKDDRLFTNTIRALYPAAADLSEQELEAHKQDWLMTFKDSGWYMIEALEASQVHAVTKKQRQQRIHESLPGLLNVSGSWQLPTPS